MRIPKDMADSERDDYKFTQYEPENPDGLRLARGEEASFDGDTDVKMEESSEQNSVFKYEKE